MADQLVTLAQVKARIFPVGLVDATEDTLLTDLIEQASDYIQGLAGRKFIAEPGATFIVDTAPGSVISVRRGIRAVTTLEVASSDQPETGGTYTAIVQAIALDAVATAYTAKAAGDSDAVGADGSPVAVWAKMFSEGTAQRDTLDRFRAGAGIA